MPDVFDQLEAPSTGDIFDQLGEPEEPQVMRGLVKPTESYFVTPPSENFITDPMGGELKLVRHPVTIPEGLYNAAAKLGGSVVSPFGVAGLAVAPIRPLQPLVRGVIGGLGAKNVGEIYGRLSVPQAQPKTVGEAIETLGDITGAVGMTAAGVPEFRPAIKLVGGGVVEGKLGQTHNEVIADNKLTTKEIDQRGFVDDQGNFNNRAETAAQVPGIETKIEPGQAHATEVAKAQEELPAPTPPPEGATTETAAPSVPEPALEKPPPAAPTGEAQPTVPAAGKAEGGVSAPPAPAIPEGGISPAKVQEAKPGEAVKTRRRFVIGERPDGIRDILDVVQELGGLKPPGERAGGEYDAWKETMKGTARLLISRKATHRPDTILNELRDMGFGRIQTPDQLYVAIQRAVAEREKLRTKGGPEEMKWANFWKAAQYPSSKSGLEKVNIDNLQIGQKFRLKFPGASNQELEVTAIDPESHAVTVKDGPAFGVQDLPEGTEIYVIKGTVSETPKASVGEEFGFASEAFNLAGEKAAVPEERPPESVTAYGAQAAAQQEMFSIQKVVEGKDPTKSADAAQNMYGGPKEAIAKLENQLRVTDSDPETRKAFTKEQRGRLKEVISLLRQRSSMVGMGGAVPSEFEVSPQTPTSIKNAQVDVERAKRGLPAVVQPARRAFGEVWDRAMAMIDRDPTSQDRLIESIRQKPRALNDVEDAMLLHRQIDLQNEYGKATRDLAQAFEDGRTDAVAEEKLRVARLSDDLLDLYNIGKKVGTETARGLNARKMMANEDFTLAKMTLEARLANDGKPLSDARYKEIQELHDKINATQKAYDDYVASTKERLAKLEIDKVIAEQKAAAAPKFDKRILAQAEKIVQGMEKFAEPASRRLRERLAQLGTTPDPSIIYDAAVVGSARIARLGLDLAKLTDSMVADFGEKIRPFMAQIWAESNKMLDNVTAKAPEAVRRAVKKADLAEIKTNVADNIADKVKKGQKDKITTQVHMLARALVKSGITDREQLIDAVHDVLKDVIPGITRRESMDAISGYGDFKQLSKDYISITLRGMKGEMQQLAKLEDMAKGQPPLKSGMERRTPTEIERRLIKEVNDAKNKFQVPVQDPNTQLKSALDTLKTTLKNRISDYQERIRTGDYAKRPRREIVLDPEASRLKAENERVKKIFQRGVALERLKNAQPIEKAGDWIVKWRRGFILSSIKTLGKLTTAAIQRAAITPAEEAIGGVIGKAVPELAKRAPREGGFNVKAEARAISQGITQGMQDAWKTLKTGQSDLDVLYGKEALLPPAAIDFFGHVHGALKAPVKRAEFARSLEKRTQQAVASGVDLSDPLVQSRLVVDSYKDANRAIFQQDNRVITAYKRALQALEAKDKTTGEVPLGGKIASTTARVLLPIVKIPTNIVAETMQYATGSVTGLGSLARAYARGIEKLPPEQADLIMRRLKKGSLGAAVLALGYFNPEVIGGYYQPGEKRPEGTPKPGTIQLYGVDIPSWALHNPLIETLQIGATVRRVADSKLRKRDTENQGVAAGIAAGIIGLGEEVPFVREMSEVTKALNPHERGAFFGELSKSMLIPQFIQQSAQWMDPLKEPAKRKPQTAWQHVEMGIPILRQNVPVKGTGPRYYVP